MVSRVTRKPVSQALIGRMAKRIARKFRPEKIILFGSHARGAAGPDSDVDLLIVMPFKGLAREQAVRILTAVHDSLVPMDVIVTTPEDFAWRKEVVGTIEWPAAREKFLFGES